MLAHHPPAPTAQVYRARDPKKKARGRTIQRALLSTSAPCVGIATGASVRVERTRRTRWRSALREKGALALSVYSRTVSREVSGDGEGGLLPRRLNGAYPAKRRGAAATGDVSTGRSVSSGEATPSNVEETRKVVFVWYPPLAPAPHARTHAS